MVFPGKGEPFRLRCLGNGNDREQYKAQEGEDSFHIKQVYRLINKSYAYY